MHPQGMSDEQEIRESGIPPGAFVALDRPSFHAGEVGEFFL